MASSNRTPAPETRDDSVMFALGELARLESARVSEERERELRRAEDERRALERAAEERALEARRTEEREAKARAVAEAEARLRVEAEITQDARMTALRTELARVQSEREAMHRSVLEATHATPPSAPASARGWPLAFGLSSVVAAALAGLLVMQAQTTPRVIEVERHVLVSVPAAPSAPATPALVVAAPEAAPPEVAEAPRAAVVRTGGRSRPVVARDPVVRPHDDGLDFEGDDVIGGIDHESTDMFGPRRRTR